MYQQLSMNQDCLTEGFSYRATGRLKQSIFRLFIRGVQTIVCWSNMLNPFLNCMTGYLRLTVLNMGEGFKMNAKTQLGFYLHCDGSS